MKAALRFASILLATIVAGGLAWAHSSHPPIGYTGAPGEPTCAAAGCHDQYPLNSGPGAAELPPHPDWVFPLGTCPDDTTVLSIRVRHPGAMRWGFELTVVDNVGDKSGQLFLVDSGRTRMADSGRSYVFHTAAGTDAGTPDSSPGWTANWVY
jgi:hypothetical protein